MFSYYVPSTSKLKDYDNLVQNIRKKFSAETLLEINGNGSDLELIISKDALIYVISFLKNDVGYDFKQLIDITAVDYPDNSERFCLVYTLLSLTKNTRLRLKVFIKEEDTIESVCSIYQNANWLEREVWDMFGIYFLNHPDLRRILTDFGFEGHPLRKDFPVTGFVEISYDHEKEKIYYKPVELTQQYRDFDYKNPWIDKNITAETFENIKKNVKN